MKKFLIPFGGTMGVDVLDGIEVEPGDTYSDIGYVYIIETKEGVKIGSTVDPKTRIKTIVQTSGLLPINIALSERCSNFRQIERSLQTIFSSKRKIGEWFKVDFNEVVAELNKLPIELNPKKPNSQNEPSKILGILFPLEELEKLDPVEICYQMSMNGLCGEDTCPQFNPDLCIDPDNTLVTAFSEPK